MTDQDFKAIAPTLPKQPGVYRFIDKEDIILYVGKAKNLKNRLTSYFGSRKHQAHKTRVMVKNADHIEYTIVETEQDALLLENTLIKRFQPRYNVVMRDDKSYSYICIKKERFPRVFVTRRVIKDGSTYFGPYTSRARIRKILDLVKMLFPLRTCSYNLSEENIEKGKFKVCLEFHINNCQGPCEGLESEEAYNEKIAQINNILRGNFGEVKRHFKAKMLVHAENLEYEAAQRIKERLDAVAEYQAKSTVVSQTIRDVDVFSIKTDEKNAYVNYLKVIQGAIINTLTLELTKNLDEDPADLLSYAVPELRERFNSISPEIVVPFELELTEEGIQQTVPQRGEKRKLLELSQKNATYFLMQKKKQEISHQNRQTPAERVLRQLQSDLNMSELPMHIECFDNSNIQGAYPVASCVVFKNAKPSKKDYRKFNIKTVIGPDDFASMTEVVHRRYRRLLEEDQSLPQLVIIDGGKGQLSSAMQSIDTLGLRDKITVIGIAKKLEEIYFPDDSVPLHINKKSESLRLIQQLRNEAHRFAISFHRNLRSKNFTVTELTQVPGIGDKTAEKLLKHFGSMKQVRMASGPDLEAVIGKAATKKLLAYLANTNSKN